MRRLILAGFVLVIAATAAPALALQSGTDIIVPAAARGGIWVTDLYVANAGDATASGSVYWLVRGQSNPNPISITFELEPGETAVFADIINDHFGLAEGTGAFRVTASNAVIVNSRIYATEGTTTFGQGFEGVPVGAATQSGTTATVVGLTYSAAFRTNVYATAGSDGATMDMALRDAEGNQIAAATLTLAAWEPYLRSVQSLFTGVPNFEDATLSASVTAGAAVVGASKVDELSDDPTTLESDAAGGGAATVDGVYQISIYDSALFAAGGNIVIEDNVVTEINGTYFNWDKLDAGEPACTLQFLWGLGLSSTPVGDFASGVSFSDSYTSTGSGVMDWTVTFTIDDNMSISGTVAAVGSEFTETDELGCNGTFPALPLSGGKVE